MNTTTVLIVLIHNSYLIAVIYLQGVWSRFFPVYDQLRTELQDQSVGDVQLVTVDFGANMRHLDRLWKKGLGGGAVMDLGIYAIQLALLVLGEEPERVIATGYLNEYGMEKKHLSDGLLFMSSA